MTEEQEQDLANLNALHKQMLTKKYIEGARKHGGDLLTMTPEQAILEAIDENLDQYVYLMRALDGLDD
jgi:hypothetical protein